MRDSSGRVLFVLCGVVAVTLGACGDASTDPEGLATSAEAITWSGNQRLDQPSANNVGSSQPSVTIDGAGNALAVWSQQSAAGTFDAYARRYTPLGGWALPFLLETTSAAVSGTNLSVGGNAAGDAIAIWTTGSELFVRRFGGVQSTVPLRLTGSFANEMRSPRVVMNNSGVAFAFWAERLPNSTGPGRQYLLRASRYTTAGGWGAPVSVGPTDPSLYDPGYFTTPIAAAIDPAGNAVVAWRKGILSNTASANRFLAQTGQWTGPRDLQPAGSLYSSNGDNDIRVGMDDAGNALAVWQQREGVGGTLDHGLWASRAPLNGSWSPAALISYPNLVGSTQKVHRAYNFALCVAPGGDASVVWFAQEETLSNHQWSYSFHATHFRDGAWGPSEKVPSYLPGQTDLDFTNASHLDAAMDGAGNITVVRDGWTRLVTMHYTRNPSGPGGAWESPQVRVAPVVLEPQHYGTFFWPRIAVSPGGRGVFVWHYGVLDESVEPSVTTVRAWTSTFQ